MPNSSRSHCATRICHAYPRPLETSRVQWHARLTVSDDVEYANSTFAPLFHGPELARNRRETFIGGYVEETEHKWHAWAEKHQDAIALWRDSTLAALRIESWKYDSLWGTDD